MSSDNILIGTRFARNCKISLGVSYKNKITNINIYIDVRFSGCGRKNHINRL